MKCGWPLELVRFSITSFFISLATHMSFTLLCWSLYDYALRPVTNLTRGSALRRYPHYPHVSWWVPAILIKLHRWDSHIYTKFPHCEVALWVSLLEKFHCPDLCDLGLWPWVNFNMTLHIGTPNTLEHISKFQVCISNGLGGDSGNNKVSHLAR